MGGARFASRFQRSFARLDHDAAEAGLVCPAAHAPYVALMASVGFSRVGVFCSVASRDVGVEEHERAPVAAACVRGAGTADVTRVSRVRANHDGTDWTALTSPHRRSIPQMRAGGEPLLGRDAPLLLAPGKLRERRVPHRYSESQPSGENGNAALGLGPFRRGRPSLAAGGMRRSSLPARAVLHELRSTHVLDHPRSIEPRSIEPSSRRRWRGRFARELRRAHPASCSTPGRSRGALTSCAPRSGAGCRRAVRASPAGATSSSSPHRRP